MRLVVAKYEADEQHSLDCILCDEDEVEQQFTSLIFYDQERTTSLVLCPEHLDDLVTAALRRHKRGISEGNPFWYLDVDKDPWEDTDEAHG